MKEKDFPYSETPDRRKPWVIEMERENMEILLDALESPAPQAEIEDLPKDQQGVHNIPRIIALGMIDEFAQ